MPFLLSSQNVFDYLISQGLCTNQDKELCQVELKPAKNFNLLITFPDGHQLLVKQERHNHEGKTLGEFASEWQVHNFCQTFPEINYLRSYISAAIQFDPENSIIIFDYLRQYTDLARFYVEEELFPTEIAYSIGANLALIHRLTINNSKYKKFFQANENEEVQQTPNLARGLENLTPEIFGMIPSDGLKFFTLYQRYDTLGKAIANLSQAYLPCCLTHNDLKLNNLLLSLNWEKSALSKSPYPEKMIRLIDWERGKWGDPTNDLGSIIASYLLIWLNSMVTSKTIPIEESLKLAATPLQIIQPSIAALITAYLAEFPTVLTLRPNFLELVIQFSGLALIRSIQAALQHEKTFGNSGICILQVAKSLLCRPQASINTVFGMEAAQLIPNSLSLVQGGRR
ncbi:MAG TPA: phosphotransferase [Nostocaceae cyanobacterium]|nr:phosphotransferase [Nostocaceae cyanobacterium]